MFYTGLAYKELSKFHDRKINRKKAKEYLNIAIEYIPNNGKYTENINRAKRELRELKDTA